MPPLRYSVEDLRENGFLFCMYQAWTAINVFFVVIAVIFPSLVLRKKCRYSVVALVRIFPHSD